MDPEVTIFFSRRDFFLPKSRKISKNLEIWRKSGSRKFDENLENFRKKNVFRDTSMGEFARFGPLNRKTGPGFCQYMLELASCEVSLGFMRSSRSYGSSPAARAIFITEMCTPSQPAHSRIQRIMAKPSNAVRFWGRADGAIWRGWGCGTFVPL